MDFDEFIKNIKKGNISCIKRFIKRNSYKINQTNSEGKTYLIVACELGNTDVTKLLINFGADLDKRDGYGKTALYYAVRGDDPDVVAKLISAGADLTVQGGDGDTVLHLAAEFGNKDVVEVILKTLRGDTLKINHGNNRGYTPLHCAVYNDDPDVVRMLISAGADLTVQDVYGDTVLHLAAAFGNKDVVDVILKTLGGDTLKINQQDNLGSTPLHFAVAKNTAEVVCMLISAGADLTVQDVEGDTVLHWAAWWGNKDVVEVILKTLEGDTLKINQGNNFGFTPLHCAVENDDPDVVAKLISAGADLTVQDGDGDTVLHWAAALSNKDVVEVILRTLGGHTLKINQGNNFGSTPLHCAVYNDDPDVVAKLISAGADLTVQDGDGDTVLHWAAALSNKDVVEVILMTLGGHTLKINQGNNRGFTPLHWAVENDDPDVVCMFISAGADLTVRTGNGDTVLHLAARWGNKDVVEVILKTLGGDTLKINQGNNFGSTPLHLAVHKNTAEVVAKLISAGADLTVRTGNGDTVLHRAVASGNNDVVEVILKTLGGDTVKINHGNNRGYTPLHCAVYKNTAEVVAKLISAGADLTVRTGNGDTVLHYAARWGNKDVVDVILKTLGGDNLKDLVKLDIKNHDGKTPLHLAVSEGHFGIVRRLISKNAKINSVDVDGNNCLHLALEKDVFHCEGEPLDILDKYCTNLELSRTQRLCGAVVASYLADNGANLYHRNNNNKTPMDLIRNPELKKKIKILFPAPQCMLCENNMAAITFQPCGHNVICRECSKIELKRCPKCRECIISKTGFDTKNLKDCFLRVARELGGKWKQVGRFLGIEDNDLDIIKCNNPDDVEEQSYQMLYKWFTSCDPATRTVDTLRKALEENDRHGALKYLP